MSMFGLTHEHILGKPTLHVPINMIVQGMDDTKVIGAFQTSMGTPLLYGSKMTHQLILGDAFIRPRLVFESNEFRGHGLSALAIHGFSDIEKWTSGLLFERK